MKYIKLLLLTLLALGCSTLRAESMKLTNHQADELLGSLLSLESGLTAVNTTLAADNINELRPKVEAYAKGTQAAQKRYAAAVAKAAKDDTGPMTAFQEETDANYHNEITVDLSRFELSNDEITAAKIKPGILSVLRLYLKPNPPKK